MILENQRYHLYISCYVDDWPGRFIQTVHLGENFTHAELVKMFKLLTGGYDPNAFHHYMYSLRRFEIRIYHEEIRVRGTDLMLVVEMKRRNGR